METGVAIGCLHADDVLAELAEVIAPAIGAAVFTIAIDTIEHARSTAT